MKLSTFLSIPGIAAVLSCMVHMPEIAAAEASDNFIPFPATRVEKPGKEHFSRYCYRQIFDPNDKESYVGWTGDFIPKDGGGYRTETGITSPLIDLSMAQEPMLVYKGNELLLVDETGIAYVNNSFPPSARVSYKVRIPNYSPLITLTSFEIVDLKHEDEIDLDAVGIEKQCKITPEGIQLYDSSKDRADYEFTDHYVAYDCFANGLSYVNWSYASEYKENVATPAAISIIALTDNEVITLDADKLPVALPDGTKAIVLRNYYYDRTNGEGKSPLWRKAISFTVGCHLKNVQSKREAVITTNPSFPTTDNAWYDVNRDGIMDFVNTRIYLSSGKGYREIRPYETIEASAIVSGPGGEVLYYGSKHVGVVDHNKMTVTPVYTGVTTKDVLYPVDVNGNGQLSLLKLPNTKEGSDKKRYYTYEGNGHGYESKFESMTMDDYLKNYYHPQQSSMFSSLSAAAMWSHMYYETPKVETSSGDVIETHDINNDGLPDLVDHIHQKIMYNVGNGRYATVDFGGQILLRDFNGDGVEDYIIYDEDTKQITSYIRNSDGTQTEKVIMNGYYCGKKIWAHDLDNDGDIDLVLPLSSTASDGYYPRTEFIIIMENKGNGTFKRHENAVGNTYLAYDCKDVDNDGCYEVLACENEPQSRNKTAIYKIDKLQLNTTPTVISGKSQYVAIHDLNTSKWILNSGKEIEGNTNTLPSAPGKPTIFYDASSRMLKVQWTPGKDKETPTADLTYSLRAGTSAGAEDVVWADAMPDGRRLNLTGGNMGHALQRVFDVSSWPDGNIYISVQAVDGSHGGSPFSEEVVFTKREPACDFNVEYSKPFTLHDECVVSLTSAPVDGYEYLWDFDGAEVVETDADAQCYRLKYTTPGHKVISLAVKGGENGAEAQRDYAIEVCPIAVKWEARNSAGFALDLDEDGVYELFNGKFEKAVGDTYSEIPKMYNSHSAISAFGNGTLTDLNHDGHVDLYRWSGSGDGYTLDPNVNSLMAINEEDLNLEISDEGSNHSSDNADLYYDLDNDGNVDLVVAYSRENMIFRNLGGMPPKFEKISLSNSPEWWIDVDRDGLLDYVGKEYSYEDKVWTYYVYYNQGDFTFSKGESIQYNGYHGKNIDLDNNGKLDRIVETPTENNKNGYVYSIIWDNGEETSLLTEFDPDRTGLDIHNFEANIDLDNNGYIDILFPKGYVAMIDKNRKITEKRLEMDDLLPYDPNSRGEWFKRADGKRALASGGNLTTVVPNEVPGAPTELRHTQGTRFVEIEWNHSEDKETPADAMRYNVSVKRKGATGEGAYLLSPCNGEKDFGLIPTGKQLVSGNRIRIPMASIAPGEYEVRVQGVDLMFESSAFSESYAMTVKESVNMELPATTETDFETAVTILLNVDVDIDWDGATVHEQTKNRALVSWNTPGIKTVKMGDYTASILVKEKPDASFIAPQEIHVQDRVVLTGNSLDDGTWEYRDASNSQYSWKSVNAPDAKYWIKWDTDDEGGMYVTFLDNRSYELKHSVSYGFSESEYVHRFDVLEAQTPAIKLVSVDSATGKHALAFDNSAIPQGASSINVYKETDMYDIYRKLAELPIGTDSYVDLSSTPDVKGARYKLTYILPYGESGFSRVHRPMHVMINTGVGGAWNILWTPYEGTAVASYRILRGTSPENMVKIDEVSGSMNSYTDFTAPAGEVFYAVEIAVSAGEQKKAPIRSVASANIARSNVVSTSMAAGMVNLAEGIQIYSISGANEIDCQSSNTLDLGVAITPMNVTISKVAWEISEGTDLATVDNSGCVTATGNGNGTVVVTAHTNDGSRLSDSFSVTIKGVNSVGVNDVAEVADKFKVTVNQATGRILLSGIPVANDGISTVTIYDISGIAHISTKTTEDCMEIDAQHLPSGIYIVYVAGDAGCAHARIMIYR